MYLRYQPGRAQQFLLRPRQCHKYHQEELIASLNCISYRQSVAIEDGEREGTLAVDIDSMQTFRTQVKIGVGAPF